jgi:nitric oxide reductase NorQ protein
LTKEEKSLGHSHQNFNKQDIGKVEEVMSAKRKNSKITVRLAKQRVITTSPLYYKYDIQKYDLHPNYYFDDVADMIPSGVPEYVDNENHYVERIVRALYYFKQCALIGPSGTGKTHIVYLVAELMGLPVFEVNCGLQTSSYDLIGRYIGLGKENWIDGQVTLWLRHGGILYVDEANMMKQDVAARLNPILDHRGHLVITEKDNEIVPRHRYGYCVISMNPFSAEFLGTKKLNAAFRRRMSVWINFSYQSIGDRLSDQEAELIIKRSEIDEETAYKILRVGAILRREYQEGNLPYGPSPRDLVNWAVLCKDGLEPKEAAEETLIALTSDHLEIQDEVRRIISSVFT